MGIVCEFVLCVIVNGKYVVMVNKVLFVVYGIEIFEVVCEKGVMVVFEVVVVGGILIIKVLCEGLIVNCIQYIVGIINGMINYILLEMCDCGFDFVIVLKVVQEFGYVEVDLIFDIEGVDVVYKVMIMSVIVFGVLVQFDCVYVEGISKFDVIDICYVEEFGYWIKLFGIMCCVENGIELCVYLMLILEKCLFVNVEGVMNVVVVYGDVVGMMLYYGKGVGVELIVLVVVVDFVDVMCLYMVDFEYCVLYFVFQLDSLLNMLILLIEEVMSGYYLCLCVVDQIGVFVVIMCIFVELGILIDVLLQKELEQIDGVNGEIDIILIMYEMVEKNVNVVIVQIESLVMVVLKVMKLCMEVLN